MNPPSEQLIRGGPAYTSNGSSGSGSVPPAPAGITRPAELASSADPSGPPGVSHSVPPPRKSPAPGDLPPLASSPPANSPAPGNSHAPDDPQSPGNSHAPDDPQAPGNSHAPSGEPVPHAGQPDHDTASQKATPGPDGTDHSRLDDEDEPGVELGIELEPVIYEEAGPSWLSQRAGAAVDRLAQFGSAVVAIALRDPLETIAVLVLGIGGAIYPPIWLVGVLIAVISRKWDLRDKWLGLGMPVLVVIFGTTLAIVLGGQHTTLGSYAFEAWLAAGRLSRIGAVLSATYLLWRVYRGPREARRPPWSMRRGPG